MTVMASALLAYPAWGAEAEWPADESVEEMLVVGETRPAMDVLAGATTTRIETDSRLIEGAQIDDLLAEVPGVQIRRFGGAGDPFEISIRGSRPEQVPVFLDGVRLDSSLTGRSDLSTICLDVLQEIQVTRGAGAGRAGSGAIGGVVNLVSRGAPEEPETRLRIAGGNFGTIEGSARHARRIDAWEVSLSYCGFHTDGDFKYQRSKHISGGVPIGSSPTVTRHNNEADRHTALAQVAHPVGEGRLKITQLFSYIDRGTPGLERDIRSHAHEKNLSLLTSAAFEYPIRSLPEGEFEWLLSNRTERNDFEDLDTDPAAEPIDTETVVQSWSTRSRTGFAFDALEGRHEVSFLAEARLDQRGSNEAKSKTRAGVALRAEMSSAWWDERLRISPSLRFERIGGLDEEWIPGLFIQLEPLEWIEFKAAASRSYRAPSFQELYLPDKGFQRGNENLKPEEAWNFEVGLVLRSPFESQWLDGEIEATWFTSEVDDSIAFQLISPSVVAPVNTGQATIRGYELSLWWRPHPWLRLSGSRTVTDAENSQTHDNLPGIAVSQVDGRFEFGPRDRFKLVGEVHYTGRIPLADRNLSELRSRVSFDASAAINLTRLPFPFARKLGRSLWLSVRGRNLSDEAIRDTQSFPQPGRNYSVALESVF